MHARPAAAPISSTCLPGTYALIIAGPNEDAGATGDLDISSAVTIIGAGVNATVIQAGATPSSGIDRVFHVTGAVSSTLQNLKIANGKASIGVGIYNKQWCVVLISNVSFSGNSASGSGGGVYNLAGSTATLRNTIVGSSASGGDCVGALSTSSHHNLSHHNLLKARAPTPVISPKA